MPGFTPFRFLCGINIERWQSETAPVGSTFDARQRFSPCDHTSRAVQDSLSSVCSVRTIATAESGYTRDNALPGFGSFPIGWACSSRPVRASEQLVWSGRFMDYLAHEKWCSVMGAGVPSGRSLCARNHRESAMETMCLSCDMSSFSPAGCYAKAGSWKCAQRSLFEVTANADCTGTIPETTAGLSTRPACYPPWV